jgi:hypothetical protein
MAGLEPSKGGRHIISSSVSPQIPLSFFLSPKLDAIEKKL